MEGTQGVVSLEQAVMRAVAHTLGIAPGQLEIDAPLDSLGFDSLMAVELIVQVEEAAGVKLARMTLLQEGLSTRGLIRIVEEERPKKERPVSARQEHVLPRGARTGDPETHMGETSVADDIAHAVGKLTDAQVDELLRSFTSEN